MKIGKTDVNCLEFPIFIYVLILRHQTVISFCAVWLYVSSGQAKHIWADCLIKVLQARYIEIIEFKSIRVWREDAVLDVHHLP